jgi:GT2 family glycosyltransferase
MKVRVIVATLGQRISLERTLISIVRQEIESLEIKVVAPSEKIQNISKMASGVGLRNFQIIADQKNGFSAAINQGWSAHGNFDYYCWINDDDNLTDGSLFRSLKLLESDSSLKAVIGNLEYFREDINKVFKNRVNKFTFFISRVGPNIIPQPGSLIRRNVLGANPPLNENYRYAMDLDLWLRLLKTGKIGLIKESQAMMFWHSNSITVSNRQRASFEAFQIRCKNTENIFIKVLNLLCYFPTKLLLSLTSKLN